MKPKKIDTLLLLARLVCALTAFLSLKTSVFEAHAQASLSVAGVGVHYNAAVSAFVARSELLVIGSNFWSASPTFNRASAAFEFSTTNLDSQDEHYIGFRETGSTGVCPGVPNQFHLYGYTGNGQTDVSDHERTNTWLLTFETPRAYSGSNGLLNVSSFIKGLIDEGHPYAGFVILPANGCAFEGFGYAHSNPDNRPQVYLVSASTPPRLIMTAPSSNAINLSWADVPSAADFKLNAATQWDLSNGWSVMTNLPPQSTNFMKTVRVGQTNGPILFFRLSK